MVPRVETHMASLADQLGVEKPGSLNSFILLDSQDWMPPAVIDELWGHIARVGGPGTRVIFRTAGEKSPVDAALSPETAARFVARQELARELHLQDRSAIYGMFHLYEMVEEEMAGGPAAS
jgi:S-adenosylmethionine-diacylglycerol 3-amino-3-carboxypropyl transferase